MFQPDASKNSNGRAPALARWSVVAVAALLVAGAAPASAQALGDCLRVEVSATVVLPDGSAHPAGALRICMSREFSPVSSLHETRIGSRSVGLLRSRRGVSEGEPESRPYALFRRNDRGELVLLGYAWPAKHRMTTYRLSDAELRVGRLASRGPVSEWPVRGTERSEDDSLVLLIAAAD